MNNQNYVEAYGWPKLHPDAEINNELLLDWLLTKLDLLRDNFIKSKEDKGTELMNLYNISGRLPEEESRINVLEQNYKDIEWLLEESDIRRLLDDHPNHG